MEEQQHTLEQMPKSECVVDKIVVTGINIALEATCYQSSFYPPGTYHETNRIVDGSRNGGYSFHTLVEDHPWLIVRLSNVSEFDEIMVFNRLDYSSEKARNLQIEVSEDAVKWAKIYDGCEAEAEIGGIDGNPLRIIVPGSSAKYFKFSLADFQCLHLDSVEIYKH